MSLFKKILYVILLFGGVGGFIAWGIVNAIYAVKGGLSIPLAVFAAILGAVVYGYLSVVLHELGHLVFGLIGGMKFKSIRFPFFAVTEVNGKLKARFTKKAFFLGLCEMYPSTDSSPAKAFAFMALGGPIGSLFALLISVSFLILAPYISGFLAVFFGMPAFVLYFILLENSFPISVNGARTDGGQLAEILRGSPSSKVMVAVLTMQAAFRAGYSPQESPFAVILGLPQLPEDELNYLLLLNIKYLLALDRGDEQGLIDADKRLRDILPSIPDVYADQIIPDIFYDSLFLVPDAQFVNINRSAVFKQLEREDNVSACRIRAYYYYRVEDMNSAFREISKGRSIAHEYALPGLAKTELRLLAELEDKIAKKFQSFE